MYLYCMPIDPFEMLHDGPLNNFNAGVLMLGGKKGTEKWKNSCLYIEIVEIIACEKNKTSIS